jgi:hypothetical protein
LKTKIVEKSVSVRTSLKPVPVKERAVAERLKMGKEGASEDWHTNVLIATYLASTFELPSPVQTLDPTQKADDLRDITKGYVFELLKEINKDPLTKTKLSELKKNDITLLLLFADVEKSKTITNTLKAKERYSVTETLRRMSDADREVTKDLMDRGLAPYIITTRDRLLFAREVGEQEEENTEIGVGRTVDEDDQDLQLLPADQDMVTRGHYGDFGGSNAASAHIYEGILGNDFEREDGQV